jgi:hypothetical protein
MGSWYVFRVTPSSTPAAVSQFGMQRILVARHGRVRKTLWNVAFIFNEMKSGRPAYAKNEELDVRSPKAVGLPHAP